MLHGVLRMPVEMWHKDSPIDDIQRHCRYLEASKLIYSQADKIAELKKERDELLQRTECSVESFNMEAHNLDQRANALSEYAYSHKPLTKRGLNLESIVLTDKANALREQGK
jgi:hypothetical protein